MLLEVLLFTLHKTFIEILMYLSVPSLSFPTHNLIAIFIVVPETVNET